MKKSIIVLLLVALVLPFQACKETPPKSDTKKGQSTAGPKFKIEGALQVLSGSTGEVIKDIAIEIADTEAKRNKGLMYRRSIPENTGMLFIFEKASMQTFWMRNTYVSLDIIFLNEAMEIVTIRSNTVPFSEVSVNSSRPAQYVLEMVSGYCAANGIKVGDKIKYSRTDGK